MAKAYLESFLPAFEAVIAALEAGRNAAAPKLLAALEKFGKNTEKDAKENLNRPKWLLTQYIGHKIKEYTNKDGQKLWAMVGFRFREKSNKRDPGYYGQFHEAGWAPTGHKVTAPDHFIREAKEYNLGDLRREAEIAFEGVQAAIAAEYKKKLEDARRKEHHKRR